MTSASRVPGAGTQARARVRGKPEMSENRICIAEQFASNPFTTETCADRNGWKIGKLLGVNIDIPIKYPNCVGCLMFVEFKPRPEADRDG